MTIPAFNRLLTSGPKCPRCGENTCKHLYIPYPVPQESQPMLLRSGERSGSPPKAPQKTLSHKEKIERLIALITEKRTPRLKGRIRVELIGGSLNFKVRRNGKAILICKAEAQRTFSGGGGLVSLRQFGHEITFTTLPASTLT